MTPESRAASARGLPSAPPIEAAHSDLEALVCSVDCNAEDLLAAMREVPLSSGISDQIRSWVHEYAHLNQAVSTPFGAYLDRLRVLQTSITRDLLFRLPNEFGVPARLPLLR